MTWSQNTHNFIGGKKKETLGAERVFDVLWKGINHQESELETFTAEK